MGEKADRLKVALTRIPVKSYIKRINGRNIMVKAYDREGGSGQIGGRVNPTTGRRVKTDAEMKAKGYAVDSDKFKMFRDDSPPAGADRPWKKASNDDLKMQQESMRASLKNMPEPYLKKQLQDVEIEMKARGMRTAPQYVAQWEYDGEQNPNWGREAKIADMFGDTDRTDKSNDKGFRSSAKDESNDKGFAAYDPKKDSGTRAGMSPSADEKMRPRRDRTSMYDNVIRPGRPIPAPVSKPTDTYLKTVDERLAMARAAFPDGPTNTSEAVDIRRFISGRSTAEEDRTVLRRLDWSKLASVYRSP